MVKWKEVKTDFGEKKKKIHVWLSCFILNRSPAKSSTSSASSSFWLNFPFVACTLKKKWKKFWPLNSLKISDFMWKNMLARIWWWEKKRTADLNWLRFWSWPMATRQLARRKSLSLRRRAYCFAQNSILHFNWMSTLMKGINTFNDCFVEAIMYLFVGFLGCSLLHCFLLNLVQKNKIFICTSIEKIKILLPAFVQSWSFDENRNFLVSLALSHDELIVGYELVDRTF